MASLDEYNINLTFVSGTWSDMDAWIHEGLHSYDLVLTSETIYRPSSLPSLISLLRSSSTLSKVPLEETPPTSEFLHPSLSNIDPDVPCLCLVAAKVIYFGVGGGMAGFEKAIEEAGGRAETVFETKAGVTRRIIQVNWTR